MTRNVIKIPKYKISRMSVQWEWRLCKRVDGEKVGSSSYALRKAPYDMFNELTRFNI